jgi:multidrug efflux pump subunit AcrA (membrane-fusion protein)
MAPWTLRVRFGPGGGLVFADQAEREAEIAAVQAKRRADELEQRRAQRLAQLPEDRSRARRTGSDAAPGRGCRGHRRDRLIAHEAGHAAAAVLLRATASAIEIRAGALTRCPSRAPRSLRAVARRR